MTATGQFMLHLHTPTKKWIVSTNAYSRKICFSNESFGGTMENRYSRNTRSKCYCPTWQNCTLQQSNLTLFTRQCIFSVMSDHHNKIFNPLRMDFVFKFTNFDDCNSKQSAIHCTSCILFVADKTL